MLRLRCIGLASSPRAGRRAPRASLLAPALVLIALGCGGEDAQSPTVPESTPALAATATQALSFRQISAGLRHTCGVAADDRAYCWGENITGQLGDGTTTSRSRPVLVAGGLRFAMVNAGAQHTCGVTTENRPYCWGQNTTGQLGDGTTTDRLSPVAVAGGRRFRNVQAGYFHTCAVNPYDVPFCWGHNSNGQLGDNGSTASLVPVRVLTGGLTFRRVSAAGLHTCGATIGNVAYCWGRNEDGQLGDGITIQKRKPIAVLGGHSFRLVAIGAAHGGSWNSVSCGLTTDDRAYCWGDNRVGALGDGTVTSRSQPVAVSGGLHFISLSTGGVHTCGVTTGHLAYCWGSNGNFQLGDGTQSDHYVPNPVAGGLSFRAVTSGTFHTCGLTTDSRVYCWGNNFSGQLGIGRVDGNPFTPHWTPEPVVAPM